VQSFGRSALCRDEPSVGRNHRFFQFGKDSLDRGEKVGTHVRERDSARRPREEGRTQLPLELDMTRETVG